MGPAVPLGMAGLGSLSGWIAMTGIAKLDVAKDHIETSIRMIAHRFAPVSTHVIVMAGEDVIRGIANHKAIELESDFRRFIKAEYHGEYIKLSKLAYNYFKHADKDAGNPLQGTVLRNLRQINDAKTILNIRCFAQVGGAVSHSMGVFVYSMMLVYPQHFDEAAFDDFPNLKQQWCNLSNDRGLALDALRVVLDQQARNA